MTVGTVASASAKAHRAGAPVTLQFWSTYNVADKEESTFVNVIIKRFEKENPGIKVKATVYPYGELLQKFLAASAAGNPPDLMRSDIQWVPQLASQGVIQNVGSLPAFAAIKKNTLPGPLSTTHIATGEQPGYYAFPDDTNTQALFWNKTDFAAAGISGPPKTLSQMYADAARLTNTSKQQYGLGVDGTDIWNMAPYIWSAGGAFTNRTYTKATGFMNNSKTVAAVTQLANLLKAGNIGSDFLGGASKVSGEQGFPAGAYAMYIDGPWAVPTYASANPKPNYGIAPFPKGPGGSVSTVGGEDIVVARGGHHITDADKFAEFLDSAFAQGAMAAQGDMSTEISDAKNEVKTTPYYKVFAQQLKTARVRAVSAGYSQMDNSWSTELSAILAGKISVQGGLNIAAAQGNNALRGLAP
ncbi:MAG: extracellular solute-binding protein [Acidobacteriota bacterium]|nr:extracellular solute-binding protein [Acidobacteriota bacterium]